MNPTEDDVVCCLPGSRLSDNKLGVHERHAFNGRQSLS